MNDIKKLRPNKNSKYNQGIYYPNNPLKYIGDINNIIYRSSWEKKFCIYCDINPSIIKWTSEPPLDIKYWSPIDKKEHRYFLDYYIEIQKKDNIEKWIIEIKPENQYSLLKKPEFSGPATEKRIHAYNERMKIWIINRAKFEAATRFAESRGYKFGAINENFIMK